MPRICTLVLLALTVERFKGGYDRRGRRLSGGRGLTSSVRWPGLKPINTRMA